MRRLRSRIVPILITLVLFELTCFLLNRFQVISTGVPTYDFHNIGSHFWVEIDPHFGVWHQPFSHYRHRKSCFDVSYQSNEHGMRDKAREKISTKPRAILLGDSLTEGYGLADGQRISDLLEKKRGIEYLNFASGGYVGTTYYYEVYKRLAKQFSHDEVWVGVYPQNDFTDNDIDLWRDTDNYRPFWVGTYPDYRLEYSRPSPRGLPHGFLEKTAGVLREFTYSYNVLAFVEEIFAFRLKIKQKARPQKNYSGFYDFSPEYWDNMRYSIEKLVTEASGKKIFVFLIPAHADYLRYQKDGESPLSKKFSALASEKGFQLIDLLPLMNRPQSDGSEYYFTCDGHWNAYGDQIAADYLFSAWQKLH